MTMKMKIGFDPAWAILLMVVATLITMSFMDDEHSRNVLAGSVLTACFLVFTASVIRRLSTKMPKEQL